VKLSLQVKSGPGGDYLDLSEVVPPGCAGVVLCYNRGSGLVPIRLAGLKIFIGELEDLAKNDIELAEITVLPYHDYITIAKL
jgi:hypothetical protein